MNSDETVDWKESLDHILAAYWKADEAGTPFDRQALMASHPQYAAELAEFFADLDGVEQFAQALRAIGEPAAAPLPGAPATAHGGRFTILQPHAEGGLGRVHLARDEQLRRTVALKEIRPERADDPHLRQRFLAEAEITGQLEHPGIVPIYALEDDAAGRPVYAMRFIQGRTLADSIEAYRRQPTALALRELLQRFIAVCQTVAYAHSKDVIHRDLKPANVMIGDYGETLVVDWGLAKRAGQESDGEASGTGAPTALTVHADGTVDATVNNAAAKQETDDEHRTKEGQVLGTPAFMPPEQARGEIETLGPATDIYALGATLYTILTGQPPYRGETALAVLKQVVAGPPPAPAQRTPGVPRALNAICLKAMARDANARYLTAAELASDVERWLADEPITAYREPLRDRVGRWSRRHRTLVSGVAAAVVVSFISLTVGYVWYENQQAEAERKELLADAEAATKKALAAREFNDAVSKVTALRERAKTATVGRAALFAQAREQTQRALALAENGPADEALKERIRNLGAELDQEEKDRQLVVELEEASVAKSDLLGASHRFAYESAMRKYRDAFRAYGLPAGDGEPATIAARIRQRPANVRDALVAALDEWIASADHPLVAITEPHRDWLQAVIVAAEPEDAWTRRFRAACDEKNVTKRRVALQQLVAEPGVVTLPAASLDLLAGMLESVGDQASAVWLLRQAQNQYPSEFRVNHHLGVALATQTPPAREEAVRFLTAAVALRPESAGAYLNLGAALDQVDESIACYQKAISLEPKLAAAHYNLAVAFNTKGQVDQAIASHKKAIELDPKLALAHNNLGAALAGKGQVEQAIASFKKAVDLDPRDAAAQYNLGLVLVGKGRVDDAIVCLQKVIELDTKHAKAHTNLGVLLGRKGQVDKAIACHKKAIELEPNYANAHSNLGAALGAKGQMEQAIACFEKAIELDPKYANAYSNLGAALVRKGRVDEAIPWLKKAIALDSKKAATHATLGRALARTGQAEEAIGCFNNAIALDPKDAGALGGLGEALLSKGRYAEARDALARALALLPVNHLLRAPVSRRLQECEGWLKLEARLPAILRGEDQPVSAEENLDLARMCRHKKLNTAAARFWATAFTANPKLADNLQGGHRYNATCSASLAAAGQGEDAAKLDDKERSRLRKQALDWLRADLAAYTKLLKSGPAPDCELVQRQMRHWQQDTDLAGIRDAAALAKLPAEEQKAFIRLWADVAELLKNAQSPPASAAR